MNSPALELLERRRARSSMVAYMAYMKKSGLRAFEFAPAEHHLLLIEALERVANGTLSKWLAALPPGSAKSTYVSVVFPTWLLTWQPKLQILLAANTVDLAEHFSRQRRNILQTEEWKRLAGTQLAADAQSLSYQALETGGAMYSVGAGSTISGLRADIAIGDDLISGFEQASSLPQLDKMFNWYLSEFRSRLKPNGRELVIGTRWSAHDVQGRLIALHNEKKEKWELLRLPMECDSVHDKLGREMGDRLWKSWFTDEMVADAKRDPQIWQTLYQQKPIVSSGQWCPPNKMKIITPRDLPEKLTYYFGVDIALSVQKGDWTVIAIVGIDAHKNMYILDVWRRQVSPEVSAKKLVELCGQYKPMTVFADNDNATKIWHRLVFEISRKTAIGVPLSLVSTGNKDKEVRAAPLRAYLLQERVFMLQGVWNTDLLKEFSMFPASRFDDQVDALALPAKELIKLSAPKKKEAPAPLPIPVSMQQIDREITTTRTLAQLFKDNKKKLNTIQKRRI